MTSSSVLPFWVTGGQPEPAHAGIWARHLPPFATLQHEWRATAATGRGGASARHARSPQHRSRMRSPASEHSRIRRAPAGLERAAGSKSAASCSPSLSLWSRCLLTIESDMARDTKRDVVLRVLAIPQLRRYTPHPHHAGALVGIPMVVGPLLRPCTAVSACVLGRLATETMDLLVHREITRVPAWHERHTHVTMDPPPLVVGSTPVPLHTRTIATRGCARCRGRPCPLDGNWADVTGLLPAQVMRIAPALSHNRAWASVRMLAGLVHAPAPCFRSRRSRSSSRGDFTGAFSPLSTAARAFGVIPSSTSTSRNR